ncbi:MAG TPA: GntR family transcriptional regulator [Bradyrhizobium sp.]|nr:GntR family transcriptional regulator [Bradyrhizobium sp.]
MDLILSRENPPIGTSIQDRIRRAVEEDIVSGRRPPGSLIDEKALAQSFDVSRTPVREALLMLAARGLVQIAPRSGIYVRKASVAELVATLEALAELEAVLARLAARRATPEQCKDLKQKQAKAAARAAASDRKGYESANALLHEAIYSCSGNPVLVDQVRGVRRTLAAYRQRGFDKPGRLGTSSREHARIVQAVCAGDDAAAAEAMRIHINAGGEAMAALVMAAEAKPVAAAPRSRAKRGASAA